MSQNSMIYLQRIGIFLPDTRHSSRWVANQLKSHDRPIIPAPVLLGRDRPDRRAQTQTLKETPPLFDKIVTTNQPFAQCPEDTCPSCNNCSS
jgi:hypothetical protein